MSRLNKTIRSQILSAILDDSIYADAVPLSSVTKSTILKSIVLEYLKEEITEEVINSFNAFSEQYHALPRVLRDTLQVTGYSTNGLINIQYRARGSRWNDFLRLQLNVDDFPLIPANLNFYDGNRDYNEIFLCKLEEADKKYRDKMEFSKKVMGLLMSVNTIPQLIKKFPDFSKYLKETETPSVKASKTDEDIADVLSSLKK